MRQFTDISVLLDRSGSMHSIKSAMESAFNEFIQQHKKVESTKITLVQFDSVNDQEVVYQCVPIKSAEKLNLVPNGGTPLLDAMCKLIDNTGRRLSGMRESDRPDQVLMVIITDGEENASRQYKRQDVFDRVTKQHNHYKWQFVYLGANQDAISEAASFGIPSNWALTFNPTQYGVISSSGSLAGNTVSYTSTLGSARGQSVQSFTKSQRDGAVDNDTTIITVDDKK